MMNNKMLNRIRSKLFLFLGLLTVVSALEAQAERKTIAVNQPEPGQDVSFEEANLIGDTIRSRINDDGSFEIITGEESELQLSGTVTAHTKRKKNGYIVVYSLVDRGTGYTYFSREQFVEKETMIEHVGDLAQKILIAWKQHQGVTVSQIDALIRAGDWGNADRHIRFFIEQRPEDAHLLQHQILSVNKNIAAERIRFAEEAKRKGNHELARTNVLRAIERDPENEAWHAYLRELEDEYAAFVKQSDEESVLMLQSLLSARRFDIARARFELLRKQQRLQTDEGERLGERIRRYLEAEQRILEAKDLAANSQFQTALDKVNTALALVPDDVVYLAYRDKLYQQQLDNERFHTLLTGYASEMEAFKPGQLLAEKKTPLSYLSGSLGLSSIKLMDIESSYADWETREYQNCTQASLSWEQGLFAPWKIPLSFLSLDIAWSTTLSGVFSHRYESGMTYMAPLEVNTHSGFLLGVGPLVRLSIASFVIAGGLDLGTGYLSFSRQTRAPGATLATVAAEEVWMFTLSPFISLSWLPSNHRTIFVRLRWDNDLLGLSDQWLATPSLTSISAGVGFSL